MKERGREVIDRTLEQHHGREGLNERERERSDRQDFGTAPWT